MHEQAAFAQAAAACLAAVRAEFHRLGILAETPEDARFVVQLAPPRPRPAIRLVASWFSADYDGPGLLVVLPRLKFDPNKRVPAPTAELPGRELPSVPGFWEAIAPWEVFPD